MRKAGGKSLLCTARATLMVAVCMPLLWAAPAAAITCNNGYQRVQGNDIATPYCQDDLLARVARSYGLRAPAAEIRNNPNFKRHVCRIVGRDIRVQLTCLDSNVYGRRGF